MALMSRCPHGTTEGLLPCSADSCTRSPPWQQRRCKGISSGQDGRISLLGQVLMGAGSGGGCVPRVAVEIVNLREMGGHLKLEVWTTAAFLCWVTWKEELV